jgi:hypothetical protein
LNSVYASRKRLPHAELKSFDSAVGTKVKQRPFSSTFAAVCVRLNVDSYQVPGVHFVSANHESQAEAELKFCDSAARTKVTQKPVSSL